MTVPQVPSTISFGDLYGYRTPGNKSPNQPTDTEKASGSTGSLASNRPSYFWIAMVGLLVIARVLWEKGS